MSFFIVINPATNGETIDIPIALNVVKCRYPNCVPPAQPGLELPATTRPSTALFWSNDSHWEFAVNGYSLNGISINRVLYFIYLFSRK